MKVVKSTHNCNDSISLDVREASYDREVVTLELSNYDEEQDVYYPVDDIVLNKSDVVKLVESLQCILTDLKE